MRRSFLALPAAIVGLAMAMTFPIAAALAAPSQQFDEHHVDINCSYLTVPGADAYFAPFHNSDFGSNAGLQLWLPPDDIITEPPTMISGDASFEVGAGDSSLSGTFDLVRLVDGLVVGVGILDAHLASDGPLQYAEFPKSAGNAKHRESQVIQPLSVTGTLTVSIDGSDIVMPLDGCTGAAADFSAFATAPASDVVWGQRTAINCDLVSGDLFVALRVKDDAGLVATDAIVLTPEGSYLTIDDGTATTLSRSAYRFAKDLIPSGVGLAATGGTIAAEATLTAQPRIAWVEATGSTTTRFVVQPYLVSGSVVLTLDDGTTATFTMDDANCEAAHSSERMMTRPTKGS